MKRIELDGCYTLDDAVKKLENARKEGKYVYCVFNGVRLYSDTVTMDSAYMEVCGCTKAEYDERLKKSIEEDARETKRNKEKAIKNIPNQIERGKKLIYPFRYESWTQAVNASAEGTYHGFTIESALEIMEGIEEGKSIDQLLLMFEKQGHSGWSAALTRSYIIMFSKNGYPFYKAAHFGEWTEKECEGIQKIMQENADNIFEVRVAEDLVNSKEDVSKKLRKLIKEKTKSR